MLVAQQETHTSDNHLGLLQNCSSLRKLQYVTAWVLQAKAAFQRQTLSCEPGLKLEERRNALVMWVEIVQFYFKDDFTAMKLGETCSMNIQAMAPFIDL
ncbi:hypothetical protein PR048_021706 [Dryococelus australis]|uniref:Uncharacterized protein n=1 Tax=Dryococelus australis TaxID=614101 RepID=A0ABQ9GZ19_9NEOP|nr:hypothetical protein PR048_021706 [Dryococelus australis]